jgi:hypothetical protein
MVTFRGHSRFYSRNSAGKYPLDVGEIRAAFLASETERNQLRSFRQERLARLVANDGPIALTDEPKIVLHVIPLSALDPSSRYDLGPLDDPLKLRPLRGTAWNNRINFDGALAWSPDAGGQPPGWSYTQVFRTGAIEGVDAFMLRGEREGVIPSVSFEKELIEALSRYLEVLRLIEASPRLQSGHRKTSLHRQGALESFPTALVTRQNEVETVHCRRDVLTPRWDGKFS